MYDYRCKNCENLGQCMPMMNMNMMNMPMMNMPMENMNMMNMPMMNMPMENMNMMNMPMMNMPMENMNMMNMPMMNMPMENMNMMNMPMDNMQNMPMMNMPMCDYEVDNDEDLKNMYPKIYIKIYPMVKHHCDMMVAKHGKRYCPSKEEMDCICKEISDKYKEHYRSEEESEAEDNCIVDAANMGQRFRYGRGGGIGDIARILIIGSLLGGRRYNYGY